MCFYYLVKNLMSEKSSGTKIDQKEKRVQCTKCPYHSLDMNNLNLAFCDTNTFANQNLYTNLVNNFARFEVSIYVSLT